MPVLGRLRSKIQSKATSGCNNETSSQEMRREMGMIIFIAFVYGILKEQSKENIPPEKKINLHFKKEK